jgi:hypothetical protein
MLLTLSVLLAHPYRVAHYLTFEDLMNAKFINKSAHALMNTVEYEIYRITALDYFLYMKYKKCESQIEEINKRESEFHERIGIVYECFSPYSRTAKHDMLDEIIEEHRFKDAVACELVGRFIELHGCEIVSKNTDLPLRTSVYNGMYETVKLLLNKGARHCQGLIAVNCSREVALRVNRLLYGLSARN